ncbi:MAG: S-layer family protein, partial [Spirulina sp. SIO3F2]|nr:S-layer family protein [Spirulina sp. SIO3F2]
CSIERVISRVTGNNITSIDGILSVTGGNSPDFFLINPNGIVFGANAVLNVPGSFLASTAESIQFADGSEFSTTGTTLLSVTTPTGLGMGSNPGSITNAATFTPTGSPVPLGLLVGSGGTTETIGLVGGAVNLTGGALTALGGRVEVGAVGANQTVGLTSTTTGYELDYRSTNSFADISLSQGALLNSSGVGSGPIQLRGDRIAITEQAQILAATTGAVDGAAVTVTARQLDLTSQGAILSTTSGTGSGAEINLDLTESLTMTGVGFEQGINTFNAFLATGIVDLNNLVTTVSTFTTTSSGTAGKINLTAPVVNLQNGSSFGSTTFAAGNAGNVLMQASQQITANASLVFTGTSPIATGTGGDIILQTPTLQLQNGTVVGTSVFGTGQGGNIGIDSTTIELTDTRSTVSNLGLFSSLTNLPSRTLLGTTTFGRGRSGDIEINTQTFNLVDGSSIVSQTYGELIPNAGRGGQISITASESIVLEGTLADSALPSQFDASTSSTSAAGDLTITTQNLTIQNGAEITASTRSGGASGTITINASEHVILRNQGRLATNAVGTNTGAGGDITIAAGASLQLLDNAQITAITSQGNGGSLSLRAGDILLLRRGSLISTTAGQAGGSGNGGNITINAPVIAGYENSDIVANAFAGNGGNITITTQGIFGLAFRDQLTWGNDITASSQFGVNGTITVNEFSLDPSSGLVELVAVLSDASDQVDATCAATGDSEFIATGRGGIPPTPDMPRGGTIRPWQDIRKLDRFFDATVAPPSTVSASNPTIQEATGFQTLPDGQIALVAEPDHQFATHPHATCAMARHP